MFVFFLLTKNESNFVKYTLAKFFFFNMNRQLHYNTLNQKTYQVNRSKTADPLRFGLTVLYCSLYRINNKQPCIEFLLVVIEFILVILYKTLIDNDSYLPFD